MFKHQPNDLSFLTKRINTLNKKGYEKLSDSEKVEYEYAAALQNYLENRSISSENLRTVNIKNNAQEEWHLYLMKYWQDTNKDESIQSLSKAGLYKFALQFFVDTVVLNPRKATLDIASLKQQFKEEKKTSTDRKMSYQLNRLEAMISFVMMMEQRQSEFLPSQIIDQTIVTEPNPITADEIKINGTETDQNINSKLGSAFEEYAKQWRIDKENKRKQFNQKKGNLNND